MAKKFVKSVLGETNKLDELTKKIVGLFNHGVNITVRVKGTTVYIDANDMYNYVPLTFALMKKISEILGTDNIDETSRDHTGGCDTCDYGSEYEWTLTCKDCKLP